MRESESIGVKGGLTTVFGPGILNEIRGQIATDDRDENPNARTALGSDHRLRQPRRRFGRPRAYRHDALRSDGSAEPHAGASIASASGSTTTSTTSARSAKTTSRAATTSSRWPTTWRGKISRYRQTVLVFDPDDAFFTGRQKEVGRATSRTRCRSATSR